ncbi:hypothetical protein [Aquabacterium humicola]|uniref:hypothetical protein n=1 Tax=Aquabacterium humicola TaxID=3237377 RepID=UPI0025427B8B|nr:hypothetical protein [Rubrivivax pictus]
MSSGKSAFRSFGQVIESLADTWRSAFRAAPTARAGDDVARDRDRDRDRDRRRLPVPLGLPTTPRPAVAELALLIHQLPRGPAAQPLRELWRALATHGGSLDALPSAALQSALESLRAPALGADRSPGLQQLDELLQRELLVRGRRRLDAAPAGLDQRVPR